MVNRSNQRMSDSSQDEITRTRFTLPPEETRKKNMLNNGSNIGQREEITEKGEINEMTLLIAPVYSLGRVSNQQCMNVKLRPSPVVFSS